MTRQSSQRTLRLVRSLRGRLRSACVVATPPRDRLNRPWSRQRQRLKWSRRPTPRYLGEELGVTNTNSSNDPFDVLTGLAPASEFPLVRDIDAYHQGIVSIMVGKGYCARADGEEIALKKGTNSRSEQYDVDLQGRYIRRETQCEPQTSQAT